MKSIRNWDKCLWFVIGSLVTCIIYPIASSQFNFQLSCDVAYIDLLSLLITIFIALYIARVIDRRKDKDKADNEIMISIIQNLISDCSAFSRHLYENNLSYFEASQIQKKINCAITDIISIATALNKDSESLVSIKQKINSRSKNLHKLITNITYKEDSIDDYLMVNSNMITEISPSRLSLSQTQIQKINTLLYEVWLDINKK